MHLIIMTLILQITHTQIMLAPHYTVNGKWKPLENFSRKIYSAIPIHVKLPEILWIKFVSGQYSHYWARYSQRGTTNQCISLYRILHHFNADPSEYSVVFTANATAALKLLGETFHFGSKEQGNFYYCQENHTSVLGMREIVKTSKKYVLTKDDLLLNLNANRCRSTTTSVANGACTNSLVVFSAQCNFSGYKMPLELIPIIQNKGLAHHGLQVAGEREATNEHISSNFFVCLDAAAYVGTSYLDCQKVHPDFLCISLYKMFGYVI